MTTDYYAALGVDRNANADEIKMAYRRLARELHPDVNPDPAAQERFKEVTQAHEVLADPDRRQMYDLSSYPFTAAAGYFDQPRTQQRPAEDWYPGGRWQSDQQWRPPPRSDGAWNQFRDQDPYSAYSNYSNDSESTAYSGYTSTRPPPFRYEWQLPPTAKPYRPRPFLGVVALLCLVLVLGTVIAARIVHDGLHATDVTTTETISEPDAIWGPPPAGSQPEMTAQRAFQTWNQGQTNHPTAQFGLLTQVAPPPCGPPTCGGLPVAVQNGILYYPGLLAYRYAWTSCAPGTGIPGFQCVEVRYWVFVNANTGVEIGDSYSQPVPPGH